MILSTLAELEVPQEVNKDEKQEAKKEEHATPEMNPVVKPSIRIEESSIKETVVEVSSEQEDTTEISACSVSDDERHFCESMRERILVLFEGFQSPNNKSIEAKVDLTLNFLEYLLAVIDERLETLDNK